MDEKPLKILAVDDEEAMREVLRLRLGSWGYDVVVAADGIEARRLAEDERPDAVVSDVVLPDVSGLELLEALKAGDPQRPVVLITAYGDVDTAVEAMKKGARDFLTKPLDLKRLRACLDDAQENLARRRATRRLESRLEADGTGLGEILGASPAMRRLFELVRVVAESDASALLTGESGTGKELVSRTIHGLSARRERAFVAVNMAALPESLVESELFGHEKGAFTGAQDARAGFFEQADGGTLFLDELAEMPIALQPKLLRALEERRVRRLGGSREIPFDVRVLAATNRDPEAAIENGLLRRDLYYRLKVFAFELPPLRERHGDVELLSQSFVHHFNAKHGTEVEGITANALERLDRSSWPGNVRELRNVIERAVILAKAGWIELHHLPPDLRGTESPVAEGELATAGLAHARRDDAGRGDAGRSDAEREIVLPADVTAAEAEKMLILETLERLGGNKAAAARQLGVDVKTIRNKLRAYAETGDM